MTSNKFAKRERSLERKRGRSNLGKKLLTEKHPAQKLMEKAKRGIAPMDHDNKEEKALIVAHLNGDEVAGWELVKRYSDFFSVIMNKPTKPPIKTRAMERLWVAPNYYDYEDLFQEILNQFFLLVEEYDPEAGEFSKMISSKLHQRVFNRFFSEFLVTKKSEVEFNEEAEHLMDFKSITLEEGSEKIPAQYIELYEAMNKLGKRQREAIEMRFVKGWNAKEISEEMGISHSSARTHIELGLKKLKQIMGAD